MLRNFVISLCILWCSCLLLVYGTREEKSVEYCETFAKCSQLCTKNSDGVICSCLEGFQLGQDGKSCEPVDSSITFVYTTLYSTGILSGGSNSTSLKNEVLQSGKYNTGLSYDARNNIIYGICKGSLCRYDFTGKSTFKNITDADIGDVEDVAFDWLSGNVYVINDHFRRISVCRTDSSGCAAVVDGLDPATFLTLHPNQGLMFWTTTQRPYAIYRAGMDGSSPTEIVADIYPFLGLSVDQGNSRIYWHINDANYQIIQSSRLDGSDRRTVSRTFLDHATQRLIKVFGNRIYWVDSATKIESVLKFSGSGSTVFDIQPKIEGMINLDIFEVANQPIIMMNPCDAAGCSHICTVTPIQSDPPYKCFCPVAMLLADDGKTCVGTSTPPNGLPPSSSSVIFSKVTYFQQVYLFILSMLVLLE